MIHLHTHDSKGSLLDSIVRPYELPKRARELGMKAIAITNHGYTTSIIDFYKACIKEGIKPILGCEVYIADDMNKSDDKYYHLILLAKNMTGYKNLLKIVSYGFTKGFYYKPKIDMKLLEKYKEGLVVMTACLGGEIPQMIMKNKNGIKEKLIQYRDTFENFYLEVQSGTSKEQELINRTLADYSETLNIPLVASSDVHFLNKEDYELHGIFIQISKDRDNEVYKDCWMKDRYEVFDVLNEHIGVENTIQAIANTHKIADMCNVEIELGKSYLPHYPLPKGFTNEDEYLRHLINVGIRKRGIHKYSKEKRQEYIDRLKHELGIVTFKGYSGYFLIVQDFLRRCREQGILVGDGRGSADNSLICYVLEITNVDPIKFDLIFSRFLTIERTELPDIDMDIQSSRKQDAVNILREVYGYNNVAQICTFITLQAKAGLEAIGKVLNIPYKEIDKIKKHIPNDTSLIDAIEKSEVLKEYKKKYPELFSTTIRLEGIERGISVHAGGVVICPSDREMNEFTSLALSKEKEIITQLEMHDIEKVGLVKMDCLGVTVLDIISDTLDMIY